MGTVYMPVNKNLETPGVFTHREWAKKKKQKFDYKTKKLRHPLRNVDDQDVLEEMEVSREQDKKQFNKVNKDFVRKNRDRFKTKKSAEYPTVSSNSIKPGTTTLSQQQLINLLATLGKTVDGTREESISGVTKLKSPQTNDSRPTSDTDKAGNGYRQKSATADPNQKLNSEIPDLRQIDNNRDNGDTLKDVTNEVPLPWRHLSVAERKRLQWAKEREETPEDYDPWGRPGAGAPLSKLATDRQTDRPFHSPQVTTSKRPDNHHSNLPSGKPDRAQIQEQITREIEKLQKEIREAEITALNGSLTHKEQGPEEDVQVRMRRAGQRSHGTEDERHNHSKGIQNVFLDETSSLSKKEAERKKWITELDKQREEQQLKKEKEKEREKNSIGDKFVDFFSPHQTAVHAKLPTNTLPVQQVNSKKTSLADQVLKSPQHVTETFVPPAAMRSALIIGTGAVNDNRYDRTKDEEKRRWLEELDGQRNEQRRARLAQKKKEQSEDGIWEDKYPVDRQKLQQAKEMLSHQPLVDDILLSERTNSAPTVSNTVDYNVHSVSPPSFLRGQGMFIDPVTKQELEKKRRSQLEYQAQVKAQIEEKERIRKEGREKKMKEDREEEMRIQMERDSLNQQLEQEQNKNRAREESRQKQLAILKSAMDVAQEKAKEEKSHKRIQHLQQRGHDVSQLRPAYEGVKHQAAEIFQPSETSRVHQSDQGALTSTYNLDRETPSLSHVLQQLLQQSEDRKVYSDIHLVPPSTFKSPGEPQDFADLRQREFGTQTLELKDLLTLLQSFPDEVQAEFRMKVEQDLQTRDKQRQAPRRKTNVKGQNSTETNVHTSQSNMLEKSAPDRPQWNQRRRKTVVKNSEKDPNYIQKGEEIEARRGKREKRLLYLQELNKERIPMQPDKRPHFLDKLDSGRNKGQVAKLPGNGHVTVNTLSPPSPNSDRNTSQPHLAQNGRRPSSPVIPTVRHGTAHNHHDPYQYANNLLHLQHTNSKYEDVSLRQSGEEYVPFTRSTEILDPSKASEPVVVSRENSQLERARKSYYETTHPANNGRRLNVYKDKEREPSQVGHNPLLNPSLVFDLPTSRQEMILQQLSSLKETLKQRQKDLEDHMSPSA